MSRRNAANFSMGAQSRQHYYTVPKTRSETFEDYLKSTGYKLPRTFNNAQCDYLFQDSDLFDCAKFLMGKAKNVFGEDEMLRYEKLVSDGKVLYNTKLTEAINVRKERDLLNEHRKAKLAERIQELTDEVNQRKRRMNQRHAGIKFHKFLLETRKADETQRAYDNEFWRRKVAYFDKEIQERQIVFSEEAKATSSSAKQALILLEKLDHNKEKHFLFQYDWSKIMNEEAFLSYIRTTIENYGIGLVGNTEEQLDPFAAEKLSHSYAVYVKDVERLQSVVVYEFIQNIKLTASLDKYKAVVAGFKELLEKARRIHSLDNQMKSKVVEELCQRSQDLKIKAKHKKEERVDDFYLCKIEELQQQIRTLGNLKTMAKLKMIQFFSLVSKMLLNQRARLDIGMKLMEFEVLKMSTSLESIRQFQQQLSHFQAMEQFFSPDDTMERLPPVNPNLLTTFSQYKIPVSVLSSFESTWKALCFIDQKQEIENIKKTTKQKNQVMNKIKLMKNAYLTASTTWKTLKATYIDESVPETQHFKHLAETNSKIKEDLRSHENRETEIKAAIEWKRSKCEDINTLLGKLKNF